MIESLEGIRGLAALIVALSHLKIGADHFPLIRDGYLFVDLFFVLSGFVICAAYSASLRNMREFRVFIVRRIGRLLPLLVFSTLAFVIAMNLVVAGKKLAIASGHAELLRNPGMLSYFVPGIAEIASTLTFTHALGFFDHLILNGPAWSISVEFYIYLLFAAICLLAQGRSRFSARLSVFALLSLIGLIISIWASVSVHHCIEEERCLSLTYDYGYFRCMHAFFLGALTCHASRALKVNATALQLGSLFALYILFAVVGSLPAAAFAFPAVFAVLVLALGSDTGPLASAMKTKLFRNLGQRSYSIYLMHEPLVMGFENLVRHAHGLLPSAAILLIYSCVLYVVSGWTYRLIENPLRKRFNRLADAINATDAGCQETDKPAAAA